MAKKLFNSWFSSPGLASGRAAVRNGTDSQAPAIAPEILSTFTPFAALPQDELIVLASKLEVRALAAGEILFKLGENDAVDYLLLEGGLKLIASDGVERVLTRDSEKAKGVIAALRPLQYTAAAVGQTSVLVIDRKLLEQVAPEHIEATMGVATIESNVSDTPPGDAVELELPAGETLDAEQVRHSFEEDLRNNRFVLSSLPEVAIQIRKALDDPEVSADKIATIINSDPATAAKIIKAANSPLYLTRDTCDTVNQAVVRLGVNTTRQLVMSFALRDQFKANKAPLREVMQRSWQQAIYHAAIAWAMAKNTSKFSPEEAMSAALLSNIGVLSVCAYLDNHPEIYEQPARLEANIELLKAGVGATLLENWGLSSQMVECARHSDNWERAHDGEADLCDLVLVAALHSYIGKKKTAKIDQVGAFQRLSADGALEPEMAINFLEFASHQVQEARALLSL